MNMKYNMWRLKDSRNAKRRRWNRRERIISAILSREWDYGFIKNIAMVDKYQGRRA